MNKKNDQISVVQEENTKLKIEKANLQNSNADIKQVEQKDEEFKKQREQRNQQPLQQIPESSTHEEEDNKSKKN